jgi:hypothetical protein
LSHGGDLELLRGALLGLVSLALPGLLGALLLRTEPVAPAWPESPDGGAWTVAQPPPRWDVPARESLAMLRRITVTEARQSVADLAACEARAARAAVSSRTRAFRRCATAPLARVDGFGTANARMLANLAGTAGPSDECRGRVMSLSGMTSALGFSARTTLRGWDATWGELLAASKEIRATARAAARLARAPGWRATCRPLPPAPPPAPPTA